MGPVTMELGDLRKIAGGMTWQEACLVGFAVLVLTQVASVVYVAFLGDMAAVPGPWLTAISPIPSLYYRVAGRKAVWVHSLHERYGPIVRIGPKEVSCNSIASLKKIYGTPFTKAALYDFVSFDPVKDSRHLLGERDPKKAIKLRRIILPLFSQAGLKEATPLLHRHLSEFDERVDALQASEGSVDVLVWYQLLLYDIIGALAFDHSFRMVAAGKLDPLVQDILGSATNQVVRGFFPPLNKIINLIGNEEWKHWANSNARVTKHALDLTVEREHKDGPGSRVLDAFRAYHIQPNGAANIHAVANEATAVLVAGSDTTSNTLTFLSYQLALYPEFQRKLQVELDQAFSDPDYLPSVEEISGLKYLNAVAKEGFRTYPSVPGGLPRVTPAGGYVLDNVPVPANVVVQCQAYSMHKIPDVWGEDAAVFNPDRFLDETDEMKQALCTFSYGPRACVGMSLANTQVRMVTAHLFRRYSFALHRDTTPESQVITESFVSVPISGQTRLILTKRS